VLNVFSDGKEKMQQDPLIEKQMKTLVEELEYSYVSDYEIAAQNILKHIMQSRSIDFETKKQMLAKDLYISGTAYYKVYKTENGEQLNFEVLNPLHTFIDRNPNSIYLKDSYRSVVRRYMTKFEVLNKYGDIMSDSAISELKKLEVGTNRTDNVVYVNSSELFSDTKEGIIAGMEITPGLVTEKDGVTNNHRLLEVLEVEWLDVEKEDGKFIMYRYEGVRINGSIYIPIGKVAEIQRSLNEPTKAHLSVNGIFFSDRNGQPFSMVLATASL
jgi:hypothetical protein